MTSRAPEEWAKVYAEKRPIFESFTMKLHELIKDLLRTNDIDVAQIECRTKTMKSFCDKVQRIGKDYDNPLVELTDLSGIRIIAYYLEDVDKIGEILKREFEVDDANSVDKAQAADPDRFGYLSVHYVVTLSPSRKELGEWKPYSDLKAEIQVRTVLQHAWAAIDHKLRYKTAREMPRNLRRQLFRLSALLELTDDEFSNLRARSEKLAEQYSEDVRKGEYDIELNLASIDTYLESSKQHVKWMEIAQEVGFKKFKYAGPEYSREDRRRLLKIIQDSGITTIRDFDALLTDASNWGKDILARVCKISSKRDFVPYAVPHDILSILTVFGRRKFITRSIIKKMSYTSELSNAIIEVAELEGSESSRA